MRHLVLVMLLLAGPAFAADPARFATPPEAAAAFRAALEADDRAALLVVFGNAAEDLLFTGDPDIDRDNRARVLQAFHVLNRIGPTADDARRVLYLGRNLWPFPFELARGPDGRWAFDAESGRETVIRRRIGRNELDVIALLRAYVRVQSEFRRTDWDGDGVMEFASSVISAEGARDGLYWPDAPGAPHSPVGDFVARASADGFVLGEDVEPPEAYLGYVYRILPGQGPSAPGGAMDYRVNGRMVAGHALIASPAAYGDTGIMTFLVGENGVVFERDLGQDTEAAVDAITVFDPGPGWTPVE
jgi:hypothetical protein